MIASLEARLQDTGVRLATEPVAAHSAFDGVVEGMPQISIPPPPMDTEAEALPEALDAEEAELDTLPAKPRKKRERARKGHKTAVELTSQPSDASTSLVLVSPRKRKKKDTDQAVSTVVRKRVVNQFDEMRKSLLPERRVRS